MAKVRTFRGARSRVLPLGLVSDKAEKQDEAREQSGDESLESLAVAGAPQELVEAAQLEDAAVEEPEGTETVQIELVDEDINPDDMTKGELRALAEALGVDPEGRIDHLRARVKRALEESGNGEG